MTGGAPELKSSESSIESGVEVLDLPDKIAKALIKNNAAEKFDSKMMKEEEE